jgi:hypothetical protein
MGERKARREDSSSARLAMPPRLYAVIGIKREAGPPLPYPTDPRAYGLNVFKEPISDDEFEREYLQRVRVYQSSDPAVDDIYRCGLLPPGSFLRVFKRMDGKWVEDEAEADRVLEDTPW